MKLTNSKQNNVEIFDIITDKAESKLLSISNKLKIDKFVYEGKAKSEMIFYDTPDSLLTKTGILLYRTNENNEHFFKIEKLNFLPNISKLQKESLYEHKISAKDTPKSQAFFIIAGISSLFTTQFLIDLENIVKVVVPKLKIEINSTIYKGFSGDGFKCNIYFQRVKYHNLVTKKKRENFECTVTHLSSKSFDKNFVAFIELLNKYWKDILPKTTTRYEYGMKITQPILEKSKNVAKKENKKKIKEKSIENRIED